jgi:hypothetical protein
MLPLYAIVAWKMKSQVMGSGYENLIRETRNKFCRHMLLYTDTNQLGFQHDIAIFVANMPYATTVCRTESVAKDK